MFRLAILFTTNYILEQRFDKHWAITGAGWPIKGTPATGKAAVLRGSRVGAAQILLQLAKATPLGERVEDTFLIDGPELQHNKAQIAIETELLEALND